jgi:hypothetical protein
MVCHSGFQNMPLGSQGIRRYISVNVYFEAYLFLIKEIVFFKLIEELT